MSSPFSSSSSSHYVTESSALSYAVSHLSSILSWTPLTANRLSGGAGNYVYRITAQDDQHTAILKYYHTHTAAAGYEICQSRSLVEYTALSLISSCLSSWPTCIRIPSVIHYDEERHVLCMEDMGQHVYPLSELLSRHDDKEEHKQPHKSPFTFQEIAHRVHVFLQHVFTIPLNDSQREILSNPAAWAVLRGWMSTFESHQQRFPELEPYIKQCQPFGPIQSDCMGLIYGDLWPNSVYVDEVNKCLWMIDFEIVRIDSQIAKGVTRDYPQLMENLWVMCQNPSSFDVSATESFMSALMVEFQGSSSPAHDWRTLGNGVCDAVRFIALLLDIPHWGICINSKRHQQVIQQLVKEANTLQQQYHQATTQPST